MARSTLISRFFSLPSSRAAERSRKRVAPLAIIARYAMYAVILAVFLGPFVWMFTGSLRREVEIHGYMFPFQWHTIWPVHWTLKNFADIFGISADGKQAHLMFQRGLFNSALVATSVVGCSLLFNTMAAYFFVRLPFPGKRFLFLFVIATFMLPSEVTIVPLFLVVNRLHLQNTYWAMIVPFYASPFIVFMLVQFFHSIPKELDEAAMIDGASAWQILWRIVVPNAIPTLTTAALIEFQLIWNLFYWPLIVTNNPKLQVLQVMIASQTTDTGTFWGRTFAGMVTAVLPVLVLFLAFQRFFFRGAVLSGMK